MQLLADRFGAPCARVAVDEGPAYGAAILAGVGIGVWPDYLYPLLWVSPLLIITSLQMILGEPTIFSSITRGDLRPIYCSALAALICGFFWEMWNYYAYPKWVYHVAWGNWLHIFEMPLLGYGGYLPFALELYAIYHFVLGLLGNRTTDYVKIRPE